MPVPSISTPRARAARQHFAYVIAQYHEDKLVQALMVALRLQEGCSSRAEYVIASTRRRLIDRELHRRGW